MEKDHEASPMERTQLRTAVSEEALLSMESFNQTAGSKPRLLLHSCCGPCSTAVIERLILRYHITVFFYNPNITDWQEYEKRKEAQLLFIRKYNEQINKADYIQFMEGIYDPTAFQEIAAGLEKEREGGKRCEKCFRLRLEKTAETAKQKGFDVFGTTLAVSPHKNYENITMIGTEISIKYDICYLAEDFKKKAGYQRSTELSKQYNLYRQNFCGCQYSKYEED